MYIELSGKPHELLKLDKLVDILTKSDVTTKIMAKEDEFERLFKDASKARSEYEIQTTEMIQLLHKQRDDQVSLALIL